jgi:hypothetical protein
MCAKRYGVRKLACAFKAVASHRTPKGLYYCPPLPPGRKMDPAIHKFSIRFTGSDLLQIVAVRD